MLATTICQLCLTDPLHVQIITCFHIQQTLIILNIHCSSNRSSNDTSKTSQRPLSQTIDEEEVSKFSQLSALWWDECGEFEALHSLNELRIPLIRDTLISLKRLDQYDVAKPLDGFWIMDVGSGGGILSEVS